MKINDWQRALLDTYAQGDFAHITTDDELEHCGDTLFVFLFRELSTDEDCDSTEEAMNRLATAEGQIAMLWDVIAIKH